MIFRSSAAILIVSAFALCRPVAGQNTRPTGADSVRDAYERLDFDLALARADSVIQSSERYSPAELIEVHTIAALVHLSRNQTSVARRHFLSALSIDPDLELDPMTASPQAVELFRSARDEVQAEPRTDGQTAIRYLRIYDPRPAAAYRSMVLPGWGQVYKGHRERGYVMMGIWGTTVAGTVTAQIIRQDKRRAYLDETDPDAVSGRYDAFNRWHKIRNNLAIAAAATWVVSYLDALIFDGPTDPSRRPSLAISFEGRTSDEMPSIALRVPLR